MCGASAGRECDCKSRGLPSVGGMLLGMASVVDSISYCLLFNHCIEKIALHGAGHCVIPAQVLMMMEQCMEHNGSEYFGSNQMHVTSQNGA